MKLDDMKIGSIVKVKGKKKLQVVVSCGLLVEHAYDGDYRVYEFRCIELTDEPTVKNPKLNMYYLSGYSMRGSGREVSLDDVTIVGEAKLTKKIDVTYTCVPFRLI